MMDATSGKEQPIISQERVDNSAELLYNCGRCVSVWTWRILRVKNYKAEQLRNLVLLSHGGAGKTSLTEAMLYDTGGVSRLGKVEDGTTAADYDPEEIRRKISVNTSIIPCEWREHKINVLDTPGYADFVGEVKGALRAAVRQQDGQGERRFRAGSQSSQGDLGPKHYPLSAAHWCSGSLRRRG
jgi:hypothetical protein